MRSLFAARGLAYIWTILTAMSGIASLLRDSAKALLASHVERYVSPWLGALDSIPPQIIKTLLDLLNVDTTIQSGGRILTLDPRLVLFAAGALVLALAIWVYLRAKKSKPIADDFVALVILYLLLQVTLGIWTPVASQLEAVRPETLAGAMILLIILLAGRTGAMDDSKIFFQALFEIYLVLLFLFPQQTIVTTGNALNTLAGFGDGLKNSPLLVIWSLVGLILGVYLLYGVGVKPRPSAAAVLAVTKQKVDEVFEKAQKLAEQK